MQNESFSENNFGYSGYRIIKSVNPAHGGMEYVVRFESESLSITAADFRRIGEDVLVDGNAIDDEVYEDISFSNKKLLCIQKALKYLEYAPQSEKTLRIKLCKKSSSFGGGNGKKTVFPTEIVDAAMEILKENGYIDDMRLALDYCDEYFNNCQMSPAKIKSKLFQKGFDSETVSAVFDEFEFSEEKLFENMEILICRKFGKGFYNSLCTQQSDESNESNESNESAKRRKACEYLMRLGYSYDVISELLKFY
jgi:SOS response regulatory protein OraA/RecX